MPVPAWLDLYRQVPAFLVWNLPVLAGAKAPAKIPQ